MDKRDLTRRRQDGYYEGASGHKAQFEWDDEELGENQVNFYGDNGNWKNNSGTRHRNNDEYGYGQHIRGWNKNLDNHDMKRNHFGKGPKGYQRSSEKIYDDVCSLLTDSHEVDASDLTVSVEDGIVTLTGTVNGRRMKKEVERLTERVSGVEDVINLLSLRGEKRDQESLDGSPLGGNPKQESKTGNWPP